MFDGTVVSVDFPSGNLISYKNMMEYGFNIYSYKKDKIQKLPFYNVLRKYHRDRIDIINHIMERIPKFCCDSESKIDSEMVRDMVEGGHSDKSIHSSDQRAILEGRIVKEFRNLPRQMPQWVSILCTEYINFSKIKKTETNQRQVAKETVQYFSPEDYANQNYNMPTYAHREHNDGDESDDTDDSWADA